MNIKKYKVNGEDDFKLSKFDTKDTDKCESADDIKEVVNKNIVELAQLQDRLYADGRYGVLILFQAMDAAGKDSAIKHVMSGINPQGVTVHSFKQPSTEELAHDYLWRAAKVLPERGKIAIFNRSYYEDVLVVKVLKLYEKYNLPDRCKTGDTIEKRYKQIRNFEEYLWENGIITVKFFLHLSKETQRKRFLERIDDKEKNWKFAASDLKDRKLWDDYQEAYNDAIAATATKKNPWYISPADKKWFSRAIISETLLEVLKDIDPQYPTVSKEQEAELAECRQQLDENGDGKKEKDKDKDKKKK
jgi:PPK2 family polyphosphate:nucleotide phosphotransferase